MGIPGLLFVAQSAASLAAVAPAESPPPDIEIRARVQVRSVEVRSQGAARLELRADPGVAPPVEVTRSAPAGQARYRNLRIELRGIATLTGPAPLAAIETTTGDDQ